MDIRFDLDDILAFATVAKERNMRKAAACLNISQPPLSRKIRRLEENLGFILFERHSDGMELTVDGQKVLSLTQPLLYQVAEISVKLRKLPRSHTKRVLGVTTAFEQGVFTPLVEVWKARYGYDFAVVRKESPKLVRDLSLGKLEAAFVALPLEAAGIYAQELNYSERLLAVLPAAWSEYDSHATSLDRLSGKPLFWFQRKRNPAYFDRMMNIFARNGFHPVFVEEPYEHDVLLARISFGEAWALLPESFRALPRDGIKFIELTNRELQLNMGFICREREYLTYIGSYQPGGTPR